MTQSFWPRRLAATAVFLSTVMHMDAQTSAGGSPPGGGDRPNLAVVATPSASYVSGDTSLEALHDESEPRNSRDGRFGTYGNWNRTGTQWVGYEWTRPIHTDCIEVYWWDDRQGVRLPAACRLLYWDGESFVPVSNPSGLGVEADRYNVTTFDPVLTSRLRLEIDGDGDFSTGLLEWKVQDAGDSPPFPPRVVAGVDRTVLAGESTQLRGSVLALGGGAAPVRTEWSRASGPAQPVFADPQSSETTASFPVPGTYVLTLTAHDRDQQASDTLLVHVVAAPPANPLQIVDTHPFRIDSPLWNHRAKALITQWIPHCIAKISDPDLREGGINNFVAASAKLAGEEDAGNHRGYVFSNAWVYNTIESICIALMIDPQGDPDVEAAQQAMQAAMEDWIPKILAAQEPDGYLQTAFTLSDRQRWSPRHRTDHEGYTAGYFLEAAIVHHRLSRGSDTRLYDAALRLADCWARHIGPPPKQEWYDEHQGMELALIRFGRYVNEIEDDGRGDAYIDLAKFLLDCRRDGNEYSQSHVPVTEQFEAVGHAVRASYSYAAMAESALESGDPQYHGAVLSLWDNIVNRKYYLTGGIGSGETSEGFGPDYSLRHSGYCESCSSSGMIYLQHALNRIHADARYADLYEQTLYNALLGSIDLPGRNFYYQNPLVESRPRYDWHGCPCCVGNIPRTLLMLPTWMYLKDRDAVYVNLFIGSTVTVPDVAGTDLELIQQTDYPWRGDVALTVNPTQSARFTLAIRSPQRDVSDLYSATPKADGILSLHLNGNPIEPTLDRGYATLTRVWNPGDRLQWVLPMPVQRVKGDERIEATRGQVALRYGPLVYTFEAADQDLNQSLPPQAPLQADWNPSLLGGIMTISGAWNDSSPLLAIPHYSRMNRLPENSDPNSPRGRRSSQSTVWIQDQ